MSYAQRDACLDTLGYKDYTHYLGTARWKRIRKRALTRDGKKCRVCLDDATEVHHRDYSEGTLTGGSLAGLISLCRTCHDLIEFSGDEKSTMREAEGRLRSFLKPRPRQAKKLRRPKKRLKFQCDKCEREFKTKKGWRKHAKRC